MSNGRLWKHFLLGSLVLCFLILSSANTEAARQAAKPLMQGLDPEVVADYIHSIIAAHRTTYTAKVVERMQNQGVVLASEDWEKRKALPLPAQFLMESAHLVANKQQGVRFRLISLWPIYQRNSPATDFERQGLKAVQANPDEAFRLVVTSGKKRFFQAIYADTAVSSACVACHNTHPRSPKRNFQLGDVMGGMVITIPLPD